MSAAGARGDRLATAGASERDDAAADQHRAVEDDWFGEDESGPSVLR